MEHNNTRPSLYNGGVLIVKENGKWGGINNYGKLIVPAIYDKLTDFEDVSINIEDGKTLSLTVNLE